MQICFFVHELEGLLIEIKFDTPKTLSNGFKMWPWSLGEMGAGMRHGQGICLEVRVGVMGMASLNKAQS